MRSISQSNIFFVLVLLFLTSVSCKKNDIDIIQPDTQPIPSVDNDTTGQINTELSTIRIELSGMKNTNGKINVALYNSASTFNDPDKAFREVFPNVLGDEMFIEFADIEPGAYAFALYHDENSNNELDQNWLGIPQEGFAFSNNAMGTFGPPNFNQAKFDVPASSVVTQVIELRFF